jgi:single-strand DNA-binding protein
MARGYNKSILIGNLTRDPDIRYTASNKVCAKFSVAINREWKGKDGLKHEEVDYPNVVVWGKLAELAEKYLHKGSQVLVEGRIKTGSYEKDGHKVYTTDVQADNIQFMGSKKDDGPTEHSQAKGNGYAPESPDQEADVVPF